MTAVSSKEQAILDGPYTSPPDWMKRASKYTVAGRLEAASSRKTAGEFRVRKTRRDGVISRTPSLGLARRTWRRVPRKQDPADSPSA
jgi:hypothetical protein